jgi:hypothetical protein
MPEINVVPTSRASVSIPARTSGTPRQLGDVDIFSDDLAYPNAPNQKIGEHSGFCTVVRAEPGEAVRRQCQATFTLPDGQITARGIITGDAFTVGISGGTDRYDNIRGEVIGAPTASGFTLRLRYSG